MTMADPWAGAWVWWSGSGAAQRSTEDASTLAWAVTLAATPARRHPEQPEVREEMTLSRGPGEYDHCPHCGTDQRNGDYRRTFMIEIRGLYDGGLFYECPDCGGRWHRWPEGHWLWRKAKPYVDGDRYR